MHQSTLERRFDRTERFQVRKVASLLAEALSVANTILSTWHREEAPYMSYILKRIYEYRRIVLGLFSEIAPNWTMNGDEAVVSDSLSR